MASAGADITHPAAAPSSAAFQLEILTPESPENDIKAARAFIRDIFIEREPISIEFVKQLGRSSGEEFFDALTAPLLTKAPGPGVAVVIRDPESGEICAAMLSGPTQPPKDEESEEEAQARAAALAAFPPGTLPYLAFFKYMRSDFETLRTSKLAENEPVPAKTLYISVMAVSCQFLGHGLGHKLLEVTLEEAKRKGYVDVFAEATSMSQKVFQKAGFEVLKEVLYSEFVYEGVKPLAGSFWPKAQTVWRRL